jgi:DNA-binding response OmpR family regulator
MASSLRIGPLTAQPTFFQRIGEDRTETQKSFIENGDFRIDLQSHEVRVRGTEAHLTSEEFDLLVFLLGHPRRVVTSRTQLCTRGSDHELRQTQFLRVLATLRQKIEAAAGREGYIRTEPWIVYHFDPVR